MQTSLLVSSVKDLASQAQLVRVFIIGHPSADDTRSEVEIFNFE